MSEPRVIYRRAPGTREAGTTSRPPTIGTLNTRILNPRRLRAASPLATAHPHSRRALSKRGVLLLFGVAIVVAVAVFVAAATTASRPAGALTCSPESQPCDSVGDPPPAMPAPPFGACPPGVVIMCPRVAIPVVMR